jgi:predicted dehydrogenase
MVQYEDTAADDSVRIYDRGLDFAEPPANFGEYRLTYRTGDMVAPRVQALEPLGQELRDWASAIRQGTTPVSNARLGLEIVLCLEALEESLQNRGTPVAVRSVAEAMEEATRTDLPAPITRGD